MTGARSIQSAILSVCNSAEECGGLLGRLEEDARAGRETHLPGGPTRSKAEIVACLRELARDMNAIADRVERGE